MNFVRDKLRQAYGARDRGDEQGVDQALTELLLENDVPQSETIRQAAALIIPAGANAPDTWWTCGWCATRNTGSPCRVCGR